MTNRPRYTTAQLARFITLARGGRDRRNEINAAMRRHPAGKARTVARLDDEDKGPRSVRTPGGEQSMTCISEAGMSTRAIAPVVGVSQSSVRDDIQVSRTYSPAPADVSGSLPEAPAVTGLDGKTRTHQPPLLNADGTPATPLPTTTPEDNT